jgi:hypothetical protein
LSNDCRKRKGQTVAQQSVTRSTMRGVATTTQAILLLVILCYFKPLGQINYSLPALTAVNRLRGLFAKLDLGCSKAADSAGRGCKALGVRVGSEESRTSVTL